MSLFGRTLTPLASEFANAVSKVSGAASYMFSRGKPTPSFPSEHQFVPPPAFDSGTDYNPHPPAPDPVVASKASSRGRKPVVTAPLDAPLDNPPFKLLKGRRRSDVVPQILTLAAAPVIDIPGTGIRKSSRGREHKVKGEGAGAEPTKKGLNRASVQPKPVVRPFTAQQETELLKNKEFEKRIDAKRKRQVGISRLAEEKKQIRGKKLDDVVIIIKDKIDKTKGTNPIFKDVSDEDIAKFIEKQIPEDAVSVLDTLETKSAEEIADFVILKIKSLMVNSPANEPRFGSTLKYNKTAIKSLPYPGRGAGATSMASGVHALLVCEPRCDATQASWCCNLERSHPAVAEIVRGQVRPYVDANPDIEDMMNQCRAAAAAAAAPAPGGDSDDPFPSLLIGEENIIYSIGPILDGQSIIGRPLIMIRIHNYKNVDYPNGIYFWVYPSFSEGGANRVFLTINGGQFMKGPDYTLTTFILDLLQVHINKYYTKHFVDKQGNYTPTILDDISKVICFFGGMIHLQTQWVDDLIAGRGLNLGPNPSPLPLGPVPPGFNRHCYKIGGNLLDYFKKWFVFGIPNVESYQHSDEVAVYANNFRSMNQQFRDHLSYYSFPLCFCLTTILDKYDNGQGGTFPLNSFNIFYKNWPNIFFVQGCCVYRKASPTACIFSGAPSSVKGMRYNPFVEQLSTLEIAKRLKSHLLVLPITTFETGIKISAFPMISRSGELLLKKTIASGQHIDIKECRLLHVDFQDASGIINDMLSKSSFMPNDRKARIIFCKLPKALKETIQIICANVFDFPIPVDYCNDDIFPGVRTLSAVPSIRGPPDYPFLEKQKVKECFNKLFGINFNPQLLESIIIQSLRFDRYGSIELDADDEAILRDSPLDRLRRTLDTGIYRHVLMSSILDEYTKMASFPLGINTATNTRLNPNVRCSFLNENGQYVELQGGVGRFGGNFDFSGIFKDGLDGMPGVYIFTATRDSKTFPDATLHRYMDNPRLVGPSNADFHAKIPIKVHTKMFLLRLVFSTSEGAIQIIVCVSSTICVASPVDVQPPSPYIPFGVDVQFNVVSIGPVDVDAQGNSTHATILATMCEYLSLGCMGAAKKGEYSLTSGYQQFFDYFDNFFRLIITECYTYVSAYISPFNSGKDIIMKHFHGVFENLGDNPICAAIRGMWKWFQYSPTGEREGYLPHVQRQVCSINDGLDGLLTPASIDSALKNCRCNMQLVVQALLDPILEQLDARAVGEFKDDVQSETDSASSLASSLASSSGMSESSALSSSGSSSRGLYKKLKDGEFSQVNDSLPEEEFNRQHPEFIPDEGSQSMSSSGSNSDGGGRTRRTNKKTRKNKKGNNARKNTTRKNTTRKNKNSNIHTKTNTKTNTKMNKTMKIKSKKFPKRIYLYSTPRIAQRMAYKYLGRIKTAKLYPARNPAKKYMVFDPKNNK